MRDGKRSQSKKGSPRRPRDHRGEPPVSERDGSLSATTVVEIADAAQKIASGMGFVAMFSGPSGTGKTMAAEMLASDVGLDLYRVDLSQVVSKYIGETEKNLATVFGKASEKGWILFFDEADALFGKRVTVKDAHDQYANIEVSYLVALAGKYDVNVVFAISDASGIEARGIPQVLIATEW